MDFLEIYTRLKLKINSNILVTYYTSYGNKHTTNFRLIDIIGFSHILVENVEGRMSIPFFGLDSIIESIAIENSKTNIYFNPYVNKDIFNGYYIKEGYNEKIKNKLFSKRSFDLEDREKFIQRYNSKQTPFEYDELFFSEKQKAEFSSFFELLVSDLANYCKNNGLDSNLKFVDKGTTSIVYNIGDKIIKIGKPRRNTSLPYCEYLLQPIINRDFEFDGYPIHIEVTQKVLTYEEIKDNYSEDDLEKIKYELIRNLEKIGLESEDLHIHNIGVLTCDNKIHFDAIKFDTADSVVTSIQNNNNLRIKQAGEFVIIDLDCIYVYDSDKYSQYLKNIGIDFEDNYSKKTK